MFASSSTTMTLGGIPVLPSDRRDVPAAGQLPSQHERGKATRPHRTPSFPCHGGVRSVYTRNIAHSGIREVNRRYTGGIQLPTPGAIRTGRPPSHLMAHQGVPESWDRRRSPRFQVYSTGIWAEFSQCLPWKVSVRRGLSVLADSFHEAARSGPLHRVLARQATRKHPEAPRLHVSVLPTDQHREPWKPVP